MCHRSGGAVVVSGSLSSVRPAGALLGCPVACSASVALAASGGTALGSAVASFSIGWQCGGALHTFLARPCLPACTGSCLHPYAWHRMLRLTIHSSRSRFAARLNSGVRRLLVRVHGPFFFGEPVVTAGTGFVVCRCDCGMACPHC